MPTGSVFNDSPGFNKTQFNREEWELKKQDAPKVCFSFVGNSIERAGVESEISLHGYLSTTFFSFHGLDFKMFAVKRIAMLLRMSQVSGCRFRTVWNSAFSRECLAVRMRGVLCNQFSAIQMPTYRLSGTFLLSDGQLKFPSRLLSPLPLRFVPLRRTVY